MHLSEAGLNRARILVEVEWIIFLANKNLLGSNTPIDNVLTQQLRDLVANFSDDDVVELATTEAQTRHDVKAIEYFIRNRLTSFGRDDLLELTHFGCTSEDINNTSHALQLKAARAEVLLPGLDGVIERLRQMAHRFAEVPMLSRTHGQTASPTTVGKEIANVVVRLREVRAQIAACLLYTSPSPRD